MRATTANIGFGELERLQAIRRDGGKNEQREGMVWVYYMIALERFPLPKARRCAYAFNEGFGKPLEMPTLIAVLRNVELDWSAVAASGSRCVLRSVEAFSRLGLSAREADEVGISVNPEQRAQLDNGPLLCQKGDDPRAATLLNDGGDGLADLALSFSDAGMTDEEVALELGCGEPFVAAVRWQRQEDATAGATAHLRKWNTR